MKIIYILSVLIDRKMEFTSFRFLLF